MDSLNTKNPCNLTVEEQEQILSFLRGNFSYNGKTLFRSRLDANTVTALSIVDGAVISSKLTLGTQNWSTDIVFSPTDHDTVAWTSGTILTSDGLTYAIGSGNTGNMVAFTYIYFDTAISLTVLQVTTDYSLVTSDTAILLCVASFIADTSQNAFYIPAIGTFGINSTVISPNSISTSKIQALAITTGLLSAGAVTAAKINVAQLSAIAVDAGTLTAGTIIGLTIKTAASGQRAEMTSANGFRAYDSIGTVVAEMGTNGFNLFQNINGVNSAANIAIANGSGGITIGANPGGFLNTQIGIIGGASGTGAVTVSFLSGAGTSIQFLNTGTKFNGQNVNFDSGFGIAQGGQSIALGTNVQIYQGSTVQLTVTGTAIQLRNDLTIGGVVSIGGRTVSTFNDGTHDVLYLV
jgi:hypothetical protein